MSVSPAARGVAAGEGHVFGAVGCIGLSRGRFAAGFHFESVVEALANATIFASQAYSRVRLVVRGLVIAVMQTLLNRIGFPNARTTWTTVTMPLPMPPIQRRLLL